MDIWVQEKERSKTLELQVYENDFNAYKQGKENEIAKSQKRLDVRVDENKSSIEKRQ